jgi:hypothetical protein
VTRDAAGAPFLLDLTWQYERDRRRPVTLNVFQIVPASPMSGDAGTAIVTTDGMTYRVAESYAAVTLAIRRIWDLDLQETRA